VSARLPAALKDAIARFVADVAPKELAVRSVSLSESYRGGGTSDVAVRDERDVAAYLTTRLPATYAAMAAALDAVKDRAPRFAPTRLLDAGAGPGTASWAAAERWPALQAATLLDRNPHLLAAARTLARGHPTLSAAQFISGELNGDFPSPRAGKVPKAAEGGYDLILAGYTFAELSPPLRDRAVANLWNACRGILVIVEPGTPAGFATILACRVALLVAGARIIAPCPGAYPCPIAAPDWCHFAERLPRSRAHMRAKNATVPFEDEKFSYLAVARESVELLPPAARIVAAPHASKPGIRLILCTDHGLIERTVLKRDKPAYKAVSRKGWGDAL
jgi:ribosomal protein RSM22 (predicted rRNA methylase)